MTNISETGTEIKILVIHDTCIKHEYDIDEM